MSGHTAEISWVQKKERIPFATNSIQWIALAIIYRVVLIMLNMWILCCYNISDNECDKL